MPAAKAVSSGNDEAGAPHCPCSTPAQEEIQGKKMVSVLFLRTKAELTPWEVVRKCVESGVMLFAPVGVGGGAIKINPPLIISKEALLEGLEVVADAVRECCRG